MFLSIQTDKLPPAIPPIGLVFKLNPLPDNTTPFFVPRINNPDFDIPNGNPPGIIQIINGNLGVTNTVMSDTINKTLNTLNEEDRQAYLDGINKNDQFASIEKTIIQSMMDSQKPYIELVKVLIDMLKILEDCSCRLLGSSIKIPVVNKWIGVPSKKPQYTKNSLNEENENAKNASYIKSEIKKASQISDANFNRTQFAKSDGETPDVNNVLNLKNAYYIGYFDEEGNTVEPPAWVINSKKWIGSDFNLSEDDNQLKQLPDNYPEAISFLRDINNTRLKVFDNEINKIDDNVNKETIINQINELKDVAIKSIEDNLYSEWYNKNITSQIKRKYSTEPISTVSTITDKKGNPIAPYVNIPKIKIDGDNEIEIPIVESSNQLTTATRKVNRKKQTIITGVKTENSEFGPVVVKPTSSTERSENFYYGKKVNNVTEQTIKEFLIPKNIKRYFLPLQFDVVNEYEIRNSETDEVLRIEQEIIPTEIDFENDYVLRLIKVVNMPVSDDIVVDYEDIESNGKINASTGTLFSNGNNIPEAYDDSLKGLNNHSATVNENDYSRLEGVIRPGLDPRFVSKDRYKTFWLVEALKKEDENITINGNKVNVDGDLTNSDSREWYGLLDKFTVLPILLTKLTPILIRKFLPIIIKLIEILTNPSKLVELISLIFEDKLAQHFKEYDTSFSSSATEDTNKTKRNAPNTPYGDSENAVYTSPNGESENVHDGSASINILGVDVKIKSVNGKIEASVGKKDEKSNSFFQLFLSLTKVPFDILKSVVDFFKKWIKKLLNPLTIPDALEELFTFKWITDLLGLGNIKKSFNMPNLENLTVENLNGFINSFSNKTDDISNSIASKTTGNLVEVSVYDVFVDGSYIRTEYEEKEISNLNNESANNVNYDNLRKLNPDFKVPESDGSSSEPYPLYCGSRNLTLSDILPLPFFTNDIKYNICELATTIQPLMKGITHILKYIQEFINICISIPSIIFGLEPHIQIPKLDIVKPIEDVVSNLN